MKNRFFIALTIVCISALVVVGQNNRKKAQPSPTPDESSQWDAMENVKFQKGPSLGDLGTTAQVKVPAGYVFANGGDTRVIMERMQNPTNGRELGFVAPAGEDWFAVFEYDSVGYVKDDEKDALDADALLESIKAGTEAGNQERAKRGWPAMTIIGWEHPPRYDATTHNLEWAVRAESEGQPVINYNTRLLGRGGVMEVTLVTDPSTLAETLPKFKTMLAGFDFSQGQKYSEFRPGDKMAAYGLTGLIVGGGTAALVKSGAFKWIWKAVVAGVVGLAALAKKLFSREKTA
ncbi:MAG TPA: DUF2167 domain-containing protein [Pyrinomonadaceae bacterium]|nr:DUF2167 domain-containing protein [Pyrinomonadaceae bacterium]